MRRPLIFIKSFKKYLSPVHNALLGTFRAKIDFRICLSNSFRNPFFGHFASKLTKITILRDIQTFIVE